MTGARWRPRLLLAGLLAAATELSGVGLVATASWLIVRAAGRPPLAALAVAIVAVRAFAVAKGGLRYAERLAGHDAVLRVLADLRARVFAALVTRSGPAPMEPVGSPGEPSMEPVGSPGQASSEPVGSPGEPPMEPVGAASQAGSRAARPAVPRQRGGGGPAGVAGLHRADLLARVVSDVDAIQDVLLRVVLPTGVAAVVSGVAVLAAAVVSPAGALVLAVGLVVGGLVVPGVGYLAGRSSGAPLASARAATGELAVDVLHGVADLAVYGALPGVLADVRRRADRVARLEARAGAIAGGVAAVAGVVPLLTATWMAFVAPARWMAVLALGALAVGEVVVPLAGAAARHAELGGALARIAPLLAQDPRIASPLDEARVASPLDEARIAAPLDEARIAAPLDEARIAAPLDETRIAHLPEQDPRIAPPGGVGRVLAGLRGVAGFVALLGGGGSGLSHGDGDGDFVSAATGSGRAAVTRGSGNIAENDARVPDVLVEHVTVRYVADGPAVLDDVSLRIPAGARVAVVGASGAGKSTLLAAIAGAVPLAGGVVRGAGVGWPLVGGVFADAHVFHATVRDNVSLGRHGVTDGEVRAALAAAGLDLDLDAVVGEDGAQVSGGQRQRLLLARALVRTPPVLLLDEPTEGLDATTADAVLDSALAAAGASTVVVVTHRYANLGRFGEIVRLEEGRRVAPDVADVGR